jgi:hypothetical protein
MPVLIVDDAEIENWVAVGLVVTAAVGMVMVVGVLADGLRFASAVDSKILLSQRYDFLMYLPARRLDVLVLEKILE